MKKIFSTLFALLFFALTLGGCTMDTTSSSTTTPATPAAPVITLPEIEGLVLPDKLRLEQFNRAGKSPSEYFEQDYIYPYTYNAVEALKKGLLDEERKQYNEKFFIIQALYRKVFEAYLQEKLDILSYKYLFDDFEPAFEPIAKDKQNYYQYCSTLDMPYMYLRNNINIERLSDEDFAVFNACYEQGNYDVTEELTEIVLRTFKVVIRVFNEKDEVFNNDLDRIFTSYDYGGGNNKEALNHAIAFEIRRNRSGVDRGDTYIQQTYLLEEIIPFLIAEFTEKLGDYPVVVFVE